MKLMKYLLFAIVTLFTSFSHDYREKWVCHTIIKTSTLETCLLIVIRAETKQEAEEKFEAYVKRREKSLGAKESNEPVHYVVKLKDALMIEP